jgi:urease accessory protein
MILIKTVLGNIDDREWAERLSAADTDLLEIDQWEAQKSRFRKTTAKGVEIAVSIDRNTHIRDGDVLLWDARALSAVVARIELRDVMIVHLDELMSLAPKVAMRTCVELGHAMGNQHWPALVKDTVVYVPLTVDRKVMASVMNTHRFEGIRYEFVPGRDVIPISLRMNHGDSSVARKDPCTPTRTRVMLVRIRERTRSRTSADACPCPSGNSGTNIAGNGRFRA